MACYCYRFTCLIVRLIGLLILAPIVFFLGGALGTYETLFGDLSITQNSTLAAQRAVQFVKDTYVTGTAPGPFVTWGSILLALYVLACIVYILIKFSCICHECSKAIDESDAETRDAIQELRHQRRQRMDDDTTTHATSLLSTSEQHAALRAEFAQAHHDNGQRV